MSFRAKKVSFICTWEKNVSADGLDSFCCCQQLLAANQLLLTANKIVRTFSNANTKIIVIKWIKGNIAQRQKLTQFVAPSVTYKKYNIDTSQYYIFVSML